MQPVKAKVSPRGLVDCQTVGKKKAKGEGKGRKWSSWCFFWALFLALSSIPAFWTWQTLCSLWTHVISYMHLNFRGDPVRLWAIISNETDETPKSKRSPMLRRIAFNLLAKARSSGTIWQSYRAHPGRCPGYKGTCPYKHCWWHVAPGWACQGHITDPKDHQKNRGSQANLCWHLVQTPLLFHISSLMVMYFQQWPPPYWRIITENTTYWTDARENWQGILSPRFLVPTELSMFKGFPIFKKMPHHYSFTS